MSAVCVKSVRRQSNVSQSTLGPKSVQNRIELDSNWIPGRLQSTSSGSHRLVISNGCNAKAFVRSRHSNPSQLVLTMSNVGSRAKSARGDPMSFHGRFQVSPKSDRIFCKVGTRRMANQNKFLQILSGGPHYFRSAWLFY